MAQEHEIGIVIKTKDQATKALVNIGKAGKSSLDAIRKGASGAGAAMKAVGMAATFLNQGLELAKKGMELFRAGVVETVQKAMEFRGANGPMVKSLKDFGRQLEIVRARIGDSLIPVLVGVVKALEPVINGFLDWLSVNRKILGLQLVEKLSAVAKMLTQGIAVGANLVNKAFSGLKMVFFGISAAFEKMYGMIVNGLVFMIKPMRPLVAMFDEDLAKSFDNVIGLAGTLGDSLETEAGRSIDAIGNEVAAMDERQRMIEKAAETVDGLLKQASTGAAKAIEESWQGANYKLEERKALLDSVAAKEAEIAAKLDEIAQTNQARRNELMEKETIMREEAHAKFVEQKNKEAEVQANVAAFMTETMGAFFEKMIQDGKISTKAVLMMVIDLAEKVVLAKAVEASTAAGADAFKQFGIYGAAVAPAFAAAAFGVIRALMSRMPGLASGGMISGTGPTDSAIARITPGKERVLSERQTNAFERMVDAGFGQGRAGSVVNVNVSSPIQTDDQIRDWATRTNRVLEEMVAAGLFLQGVRS